MNDRQFILIGPKGNFLVRKESIVDIKLNGNNFLKNVQTEFFSRGKTFVNPYAYVSKKEKPALKDLILQEMLKITEFYEFSSRTYLYVEEGLESLNITEDYFKNENWKHLGLNIKYSKLQYLNCLNNLKEIWLKKIIGKEIFYTTISVPENANKTIRLELSELKPYLGRNWEKLVNCGSDHVINIIDSFLKKSTKDKVVQIEACVIDKDEKVNFKELHETNIESLETKNKFLNESKINRNRNKKFQAFKAKTKVSNQDFLSEKIEYKGNVAESIVPKQNTKREIFYEQPKATKHNVENLSEQITSKNKPISVESNTTVDIQKERCNSIEKVTKLVMNGELDKVQEYLKINSNVSKDILNELADNESLEVTRKQQNFSNFRRKRTTRVYECNYE